ncbi:MAG: hypothetical protein ACYCXU_07460 [Thermoleophilia bacterium]
MAAFFLTMISSVAIAVVPFIARPIMGMAINGIDQVNAGAFLGSFGVTVFLFAVPATKEQSAVTDLAGRKSLLPPSISGLADQVLGGLTEVQPGGTILTDDKAPVEWLTDQMIVHYATGQ